MKAKKKIGLALVTLTVVGAVGIPVVACGTANGAAVKTAPPQQSREEQGEYAQGSGAPTADPGAQQEGYKPWLGPVFKAESGETELTEPQLTDLALGARFRAVYTAEVADGYAGTAYTYTKVFTLVAGGPEQTGKATVAYDADLAAPAKRANYQSPTLQSTNYVKGQTRPGAGGVTVVWQFLPESNQSLPTVRLTQEVTVKKGVWPAAVFDETTYPQRDVDAFYEDSVFAEFEPGTLPQLPKPAKGYKWQRITYRPTNYTAPQSNNLGIRAGATALPAPAGLPPSPPEGFDAFGPPTYKVTFVEPSTFRSAEEKELVGTVPTGGDDGTLKKLSAGRSDGGPIDGTASKFGALYVAKPKAGKGRSLVVEYVYNIVAEGKEKLAPTGNAALAKDLTEDEVRALKQSDAVAVIMVAVPDADLYETAETESFTYIGYFWVNDTF